MFDIVVKNLGGTEWQAYSPDTVIGPFSISTGCGPYSTTITPASADDNGGTEVQHNAADGEAELAAWYDLPDWSSS